MSSVSAPAVIRRLEEAVVNRIAAGEVIQRPANALKELIENCLDAKANNISVTVKSGGLKLLQIADNGTGIRRGDLDIVCERFTTSKLCQFEDLSTIATYGFRGEALASISHIAHLTITTKTAEEPCAYRGSYEDGKLKAPSKPCAGNQGTQITVEDLFYNVPTRRKALSSPTEEHNKICDVIGRYAIHNAHVGFSLKKQGDSLSDLRTPVNSSHTDNIRNIYGNNIAKELLEVELNDEAYKFKLHGFVTNVNFSTKKFIFLLFINHRLVDSTALRKVLTDVYSSYLPKGKHPWIYLSLELDPRTLDVNVHPTKHEVHFLHEDSIVDRVSKAIETKLLGCNTSRVFYTQARLPGASASDKTLDVTEKGSPIAPKQMVRTDCNMQKLDKFFGSPTVTNKPVTAASGSDAAEEVVTSSSGSLPAVSDALNNGSQRDVKLTSVLELRHEIEASLHLGLREIIKESTFVGCVSPRHATIQHNTKLYLCNTARLCTEFLYQLLAFNFGNFGVIRFQAIALYKLVLVALEQAEAGWTEVDGPKEEIAESVCKVLMKHADMLEDYFSIEIDKEGNLTSLPLLLDNFNPDISDLPLFILRLATDGNWTDEKQCFDAICRLISNFYSRQFTKDQTEADPEGSDWQWVVEHIIYRRMKVGLLPPKCFTEDATVLQIANLPDLYKVFERC